MTERQEAWAVVEQNKELVYDTIYKTIDIMLKGKERVSGFSRDDLFEEAHGAAFEGALKAVETYQPERGTALSTYAVTVIRNAVFDAFEKLFNLRGVRLSHEKRSTVSEGPIFVSYETLSDTDLPADEGFEDEIIDQVDREAKRTDDQTRLAPILARMTPAERDILDRIAGGMTLEAVAKDLKLTFNQVKWSLEAARKKARAAA